MIPIVVGFSGDVVCSSIVVISNALVDTSDDVVVLPTVLVESSKGFVVISTCIVVSSIVVGIDSDDGVIGSVIDVVDGYNILGFSGDMLLDSVVDVVDSIIYRNVIIFAIFLKLHILTQSFSHIFLWHH